MRLHDWHKPPLRFPLPITTNESRVHWFMYSSQHARTSATAMASTSSPDADRNMAILVETTIVYRRLISRHRHRPETSCIHISNVFGYVLRIRVRRPIMRRTRRRWQWYSGCLHDDDEEEKEKYILIYLWKKKRKKRETVANTTDDLRPFKTSIVFKK